MLAGQVIKQTGITFEQIKKGSLAVHFSSTPERQFRPIDAVCIRERIDKPVKIITYRNIEFNIEDADNLIIDGKEGCPDRIENRFFDLLYCFPVLKDEEIECYDEIRDCNTTDTVLSPTSEIDHIKTITIKGHFKYLDRCESGKDYEMAFQQIRLPPKYVNENTRPLRFCSLETIDLSGCCDLQFLNWFFLSGNLAKKVILPAHNFNVNISDYSRCLVKVEEVVNIEYASVKEEGGCCLIE